MEKKIPKSFTLETERFVLRIPNSSDIPHIYSATQYEGFNDGMLWEPPKDMEELVAPLKRHIKAWEKESAYCFTIVRRGTDQLVGRISIRPTSKTQVWNVGFWTHPEFQHQGIMTESLASVLGFGFEQLFAIRIEASYALWNKASEKVLKRNGMKFVEYIEQGFQKRGKWVEENLYAIDKEDWMKHF